MHTPAPQTRYSCPTPEPGLWWLGLLQRPCCAGIIAEEVVEPLPDVLKSLVKRIINWGIVNPNICPDTAIVNFYDTDDCIPPHVDHKDFVRPFVTISLLSQQSIMFGPRLIPVNDGEFGGPPGTPTKSIPLPPGELPCVCGSCHESMCAWCPDEPRVLLRCLQPHL